jgi:hypothetical protein
MTNRTGFEAMEFGLRDTFGALSNKKNQDVTGVGVGVNREVLLRWGVVKVPGQPDLANDRSWL